MFWLNKFIAALILPPLGPLLLSFLGLALMRRTKKLGKLMAYAGLWILLLLSVPVVSGVLSWAIAEGEPLVADRGRDAQAIVLLGGGIIKRAPEYGGDWLAPLSLERAHYGAFLAKQRRLPILVAGGVVREGRPEADVISDVLDRDFGVPVKWRETQSRNTHENALNAARILHPLGIRRVLLVTHGVDMRRARREMTAAGFEVTPAPTFVPDLAIESVWDFVPNMSAYRGSSLAIYEMLGNLKATIDGLP